MSERIALAIISSGRSPRELAKDIGITVARISQLKSGSGGIKAENLFALARATGFSARWLAEEEGAPRDDQISSPDQVAIQILDETNLCPLVWLDRHALLTKGLAAASLYCLRMSGTSMEPTFCDGEVLVIDSLQVEPSNSGIFAIRHWDGQVLIRRLIQTLTDDWLVRSDNENRRGYPYETLSSDEISQVRILGKVIWHAGFL